LHISNEIFGVSGPTLNMKSIYVSYISSTHSLILCSIFNNLVHETKFPGVELSTCGIRLALKKFQILEHFRVQIFG
jgi:hypothetical protein